MTGERSDEELEEKTWKEEDDWTDRVSTTLRADESDCLLLLLEAENRYDCAVLRCFEPRLNSM